MEIYEAYKRADMMEYVKLSEYDCTRGRKEK